MVETYGGTRDLQVPGCILSTSRCPSWSSAGHLQWAPAPRGHATWQSPAQHLGVLPHPEFPPIIPASRAQNFLPDSSVAVHSHLSAERLLHWTTQVVCSWPTDALTSYVQKLHFRMQKLGRALGGHATHPASIRREETEAQTGALHSLAHFTRWGAQPGQTQHHTEKRKFAHSIRKLVRGQAFTDKGIRGTNIYFTIFLLPDANCDSLWGYRQVICQVK